ncbi:hypothetical protein VTN77DRAFT_7560 [Rasamsonia byssochlamydoides]|uniref:uncharacterized protein n=1 Tax=Rasamsonia byssochlamydoides TaxID=89139 RepID=UPI003744655C
MANLTEVNREFSNFAEACKRLAEEVKSRREWISTKWTDTQDGEGKEIKLLEYACGPGTVSKTLEPFVTKVIGLDVSENMVAEFNKSTHESGISPEKMFALQGDLLAETVPQDLLGLEFFDFDIIVVSMALHHFADPNLAMERLGSRLKKGGVLLIIDFVPDHRGGEETQQFHPEAHRTIHKHGFDAGEMRELYAHAGVEENIDYQIVERPMEFKVNGHEFKKVISMARGERD